MRQMDIDGRRRLRTEMAVSTVLSLDCSPFIKRCNTLKNFIEKQVDVCWDALWVDFSDFCQPDLENLGALTWPRDWDLELPGARSA